MQENTERTSSFVILISLLRPSGVADLPSARQQAVIRERGPRFTDLVVKCLIKLTKALGLTINDVDLDKLLKSIHDYLEDLGIDEIRKRSASYCPGRPALLFACSASNAAAALWTW